jgi:DMSO/TMAO reductase YedYZ molybdopterin-dependent catalytic subunit
VGKAKPGYQQNFLTPADSFYEITRGRPYALAPDARENAGLTPGTWRLEIVPDDPPWQATLNRSLVKTDNTALTMADLETLFRARPVRCIKTMQCLLDSPPSGLCSNGFWEGVALRDVLARLGRLKDVRRVFYTGYYENPKHRFVSSLSLSDILETPPGHIPVFLAFRLNGRPLPVERGGPVRMLVPESYGFKSIKWLNRIVLTNDYRPNDTYAIENPNYPNDPSTFMKTLARLDVHAPQEYRRDDPITMRGVAIVGPSGLKRVEYWLRRDQGTHGELELDDPAWQTATWKPADLLTGPPPQWKNLLPNGKLPDGVFFLDPVTGTPNQWPLPYSWVPWSTRLEKLEPGAYEFRARTVDLNDFAQPEPRPNPQSGIADVPVHTFVVS